MPFRGSNICILALLGSTRQQYHQPVPVLAKIDPITGAEINPELIDAGTHTFHVREVALPHPMNGCRHLDSIGHIQAIETFGIRTVSLSIQVFPNLYPMTRMVAYMLPFEILNIGAFGTGQYGFKHESSWSSGNDIKAPANQRERDCEHPGKQRQRGPHCHALGQHRLGNRDHASSV
jgi:hypothetical protein